MGLSTANAFFSCSFRDDDRKVNGFFRSICSGLGVACENVDGAYTRVPPEEARRLISDSDGLIAVITQRERLSDAHYAMSSSVKEEITMAYAIGIPVYIFIENGVKIDGMMENFGTLYKFKRDSLFDYEVMAKIIRSIDSAKMAMISSKNLVHEYDPDDIIAEESNYLVELKEISKGDFIWCYSTMKRLKFKGIFEESIPITFVATSRPKIPRDAEKAKLEISVKRSSGEFTFKERPIRRTPYSVKTEVNIDPSPGADDWIEYSAYSSSKYYNPIYFEDAVGHEGLSIDSREYSCIDGFIFIQRTELAIVEIRFPRNFGLRKADIRPFVGSYTNEVDHLVQHELERLKYEIKDRSGYIDLVMEIKLPRLRHMYGFAWNPPKKNAG